MRDDKNLSTWKKAIANRGRTVGDHNLTFFKRALFGQGLRSPLRGRRAIKIVGVGKDEVEALKAMDALQPEVIIIEEPNGGIRPSTLGTTLQRSGAGRVVALNIDHNYAAFHDRLPFVIIIRRILSTQFEQGGELWS